MIDDTPNRQSTSPWRDAGVYLITGGAGGLGLIFAKEIVSKARGVTLVLTGRSALSAEKQAQLEELEQLNCASRVEYLRMDVSNEASVSECVAEIVQRHGTVHGILHAAGVVEDNFVIKKDIEEIRAVLAPKVLGTTHLDRATQAIELDFLILFSSVSGALGNVGQSDYALANAFMDWFAVYRNRLAAAGKRHGRTLSINWPLWTRGGMRVDEGTATAMRRLGLEPLATASGIDALYRAWNSGESQVVVLAGDHGRLREFVSAPAQDAQAMTKALDRPVAADIAASEIRPRTVQYLKELLSTALKVPAARIDSDAGLENYGIDSVLALKLVNELEGHFGSLPKTLMFEYQCIDALAGYFIAQHHATLLSQLNLAEPATSSPRTAPSATALLPSGAVRPRRRRFAMQPPPQREAGSSNVASDIAIIGLSGRFPGANEVDEYWENLRAGKDCITEIPPGRWDHRQYFDTERGKAGKCYSKWGGFIDGVDEFDPLFFNISPREAALVDPQERLFLQCVYHTLEDAGYTRETLKAYGASGLDGNVGVFVGVMYEEYQLYGAQAQALGEPYAVGGNPSSIANRVSYFCNFHGPSMAVDTMCSSSLTAIHLACESLRHGGCEVAIAGGVNVSVHPNKYLLLSQGQFASSTGRCESFGSGGDGYVPGEGVGAVLLKPLSRAIADGDHIYGVIRGTSINHGGKTNGYTVPNPAAQAQVIANALKVAKVDARTISYIEAHGTGTSLGDPIEIAGLTQAFSAHTGDTQYCAIGSAKSNIGHLESAAGIAALTKVLLQMKHRTLVPSLHSAVLNPHIDFERTPFKVQQELAEWRRPVVMVDGKPREYPRIAGISSFGAGGSNAHMIVEEYSAADEPAEASVSPGHPALIVLSAKSEEQLREQVQRLLAHVRAQGYTDADLNNIAYTLQVGREAMEERLAFTAVKLIEFEQKLSACLDAATETHGADGFYRGEVKKNKEALSSFSTDADTAALLAIWLEKGKYAKLLEVWVKGLAFDWTKLYAEGSVYESKRPRRIPLPTYSFAREKYWVAAATSAWGMSRHVASVREDAELASVMLKKVWRASAGALGAGSVSSALILCTQETEVFARRVAMRFERSAVLVIDGAQTPDEFDGSGYAAWIDVVGCGSQRMDEVGWLIPLQRWVEGCGEGSVALCVTRGLEAHENDAINLSGADRVGLYRMLSSEYARLSSRHVDVEAGAEDEVLIDQIVSECAGQRDEVEVCYREGERYVASLEELADISGGLEAQARAVFPSDQVVWITGGTRGLGYACAQHFVREYGVKQLVLTGREVFPPREQWSQSQREDSALGRKIRSVLALESQGAQVQVLSVSLLDEAGLRESVEQIKQRWGSIGGVLHCAGMVEGESPAFVRKRLASMEQVLAPKVSGLDHLVSCFAGQELAFFVVFSSVSAAVPSLGVGGGDYAMANAYMDYVAQANARRLGMRSIQWPSWKETGMGEVSSAVYRELGFISLSTAQGLSLLDRVLAQSPAAVVLPAVVDRSRWQPARLMKPTARTPERVNDPPGESSGVNSGTSNGSNVSLSTIQGWIEQLVSQELKLEVSRVRRDVPLADYGVDSIMLAQLLRPVSERVGERIDPSILFEHPTIEGFSTWLMKTHGATLQTLAQVSSSASDVAADRNVASLLSNANESTANELSVARAEHREQQVDVVAAHKHQTQGSRDVTDIAVVGMSCRFAGATDVQSYWQLLRDGRSAIRRVPGTRWGAPSKYYAGVLDDATQFDPEYFSISVADARAMDPQALLVLEESLSLWHQGGYSEEQIKGARIGVYVGARSQHTPQQSTLLAADNPIMAVGANYLAANISRYFDLRGPSVVIDTACSSALVAMNIAVQGLRAGEIESALVGGVSLLTSDAALGLFERRGILNEAGEFHLFDGRAAGSVLGEGAGMVWLKTVDRALRDGDSIYAVIKALAINNDGRTAGPASPNLEAQKEVMRRALSSSGKQAQQIEHIEVNGSGTEVTDLLELKGIEAVYRASSDVRCELGSMKPNIGHPLCAEGIASFIKTVLMLHHGERVPFLSAQVPMQHYDLSASPFRFAGRGDTGPGPRVAGINCFADGGTNAHVILESWQEREARQIVHQPIAAPVLRKIDCRATSKTNITPFRAPARQTRRVLAVEQTIKVQAAAFWERRKDPISLKNSGAQEDAVPPATPELAPASPAIGFWHRHPEASGAGVLPVEEEQ